MHRLTFIGILLLASVAGKDICAQKLAAKDSLLQIAKTTLVDSVRLSSVIDLISIYAADEAEIKEYSSYLPNRIKNENDHLLRVLKASANRYCKLGLTDKCEEQSAELVTLATKQENAKFVVQGRLIRSRHFSDIGDLKSTDLELAQIDSLLTVHDFPLIESAYYLERSIVARKAGEWRLALSLNRKAETALEGKNVPLEIASLLINRGRTLRYIGEVDSAAFCYLAARDLALEHDIHVHLPTIYNNLGNISHIQGKYDEAIDFYMQSIQLKEANGDLRGLSIGYHNVGAIKNDVGAYQEALKLFEKSNSLAIKIGFKTLEIHNFLKMGYSFQMLENHAKGLDFYQRALTKSRAAAFKKGETTALIGLGISQTHLGQLELANSSLLEGLQQAKATNNKSEECSALVALADWYINLDGSALSGSSLSNYEIEELLLRAKQLSQEMNYGEKKLLVYDGLTKLYGVTGDNGKKAAVLEEYMALKDSIYSEKRSQAITDWETKYATAEKEKEIIALAAENRIAKVKTRFWVGVLGGSLIVLGLFTFLGFKYQRRKNAQKQMEEAERFRTKLSSDLHDDVGTMLSSLAMQSEVMGLTADPGQVVKFEKLSKMSREAMSRMRDTVWAIDSRKDAVENLVDRMKDYISDTMVDHRLQTEFKIEINDPQEKLRPDVRQNIYLIFKEAVNNAVKYSNGDKLEVIFRKSKSDVALIVHDNGIVDPEKVRTSGTGLSNMKMRAERIGLSYTIDVENGFRITIG